jgi:hypothetical protein
VDDPDLELRGDAYEHAYLAAYAHPKVGGVHLWGWAKEAISVGQDPRSNTQLVASLTVRNASLDKQTCFKIAIVYCLVSLC